MGNNVGANGERLDVLENMGILYCHRDSGELEEFETDIGTFNTLCWAPDG